MRGILATLAASVAVLAAYSARGYEGQAKDTDQAKKAGEPSKEASFWMKQKLERSQNILAGLTEPDFDVLLKNAQAMRNLGFLERWARSDVPGYREQTHVFGIANDQIILAAREKNLDGATLAYAQLVVSCVNCHKLVRAAKQ